MEHPFIQLKFTEALAMAELLIRLLSPKCYAEIKGMDEHPTFLNAEGTVLLAYGKKLVVNTGTSVEEFHDWINAHRTVVQAAQTKSISIIRS